MKLSVLMPVYNEQATLDLAVKKVLDADYPCEMELIIVDDGSTDGTRDLYVITCDADLEYFPADIPSLLAPVVAGDAKVVHGSRTFGSYKARSREAGKKLTWRGGVKAVLILARERLSPLRLQ